MKKIDFKKLIPHLIAIVAFLALGLIYFHPVLEGYELKQGDIEKHKSMSHEIQNHEEKYDERALWSGNMFGGMPTYLTKNVKYDWNINQYALILMKGGLPHPASAIFAYLLGFYILLLCLRINPWLSFIGAVAFAFSSYFFIIIEAGHTSKTYAIAFMAPVLGGFIQAIRGNLKIGLILIAVFTSLQLYVNHLQITYYLFFVLIAVGIAELINSIKQKELDMFFKKIGLILLAAILGVLPNLGNLLITAEYSAQSTRGTSDLTVLPTGESALSDKSSGLDKSYITQWSYGIDETFTLIVPNIKGGNSYPILAKEEEIEKLKKEDPRFFNLIVSEYQNNQNAVGSYFGNQPITSGPVYIGIVVFMLAILSLAFIKDRLVISLAIITLLTIMLSWGKNFMWLTEFFIDYMPGYNKFRAVAMILLVTEFTTPIMAVLFIDRLIKEREAILLQKKKLFILLGSMVFLLLMISLSPSSFVDLLSEKEYELIANRTESGDQGLIKATTELENGLINYREDLVSSSALSSLKYLIPAIAVLLLFLFGKIQKNVLISVIGILILVDLWTVNKQYVNNKLNNAGRTASNKYLNWVKPDKFDVPYEPSVSDQFILNKEIKNSPKLGTVINERTQALRKKDKGSFNQRKAIDIAYGELMEHTHYRVMNTLARMDQDVKTPYFHKSLGGYHGAKLKKYQELIDFYLGVEHFQLGQTFARGGRDYVMGLLPSMKFTNLLNTKYIIGPDITGQSAELVVENPHAYGNAWFVNKLEVVPNADSAILKLRGFDLRQVAIIEAKDTEGISFNTSKSAIGSSINLVDYHPNQLTYRYTTTEDQFAVFSEVYYSPGWNAYINGEKVPFTKVNYILRGMNIPKGEGELIFKFEPSTYQVGKTLTAVSSLLILLLIGLVGYKELKN